ncbi:pterin dehydratase [Prosthecochloris sp. GSB1]|uniref:4a-hydroxytetrahydrobiopterin dehydratase n=1 Tax=Prosthecochloris sp. GSB1 TaxID=281093 RepID=UPI000B8C9335|nr:4a-hydroxytetrahydrobiopterin dehydratase [Prosthecochloris sp. GSB1]ASQ90041.1 pterin dehydratase [Prosthecochloris sp. GSB1]
MRKLDDSAIEKKADTLHGWMVVKRDGGPRLEREFPFDDFTDALAFTLKVGVIAEKADHHPLMETGWGRVRVVWWSHSLGGLSERDFEMAEKTSALYVR